MKEKVLTRGAGILLPVASLPSDYGIGTLGNAAYSFIDLLVDLRQKYWQVLPIGPTSFGDSPYQSFSTFAGNPYLIDLGTLVKEGLLTGEEIAEYDWGGDEDDINYAALFENRFRILQKAFGRFDRKEKEFRRFCEEKDGWLHEYSFFMALKTFSGNREWLQWEPGLRNRDPVILKEYEDMLADQIVFWKFCQFKFFEQWGRLKKYANARGILIIGDVPLYVALDSADVWAHRETFQLQEDGTPEVVAGCPPDMFSESGQCWGNPIYEWDVMERDGFSWWRRRIAAITTLYDILRIDHFIGIIRYYAIPAENLSGKGGRWVKGPGRKLMDVIEEAAKDRVVIAENLGISVPGAKKLMAKAGWPGLKVLLFAFDGNTANEHLPHNYTETGCVVYAGTHDNDTVVGHFRDNTEYELAFLYEYLGIHSKEEIPDALIRLAYSSIADVVIIQMQDILKLGNEARMNLPSTVGENWRWRFKKDGLTEERRAWLRTLATIYRR